MLTIKFGISPLVMFHIMSDFFFSSFFFYIYVITNSKQNSYGLICYVDYLFYSFVGVCQNNNNNCNNLCSKWASLTGSGLCSGVTRGGPGRITKKSLKMLKHSARNSLNLKSYYTYISLSFTPRKRTFTSGGIISGFVVVVVGVSFDFTH